MIHHHGVNHANRGGDEPQMSPISTDFQRRAKEQNEENQPPRASFLLLESAKIGVICGSIMPYYARSCRHFRLGTANCQLGTGRAFMEGVILPATMVPSHFNATPANLRTRAVQGRRRCARTRRRSSLPTTARALATFAGSGSWAEPFWQTAHRRIGFGSPPALFRRWEPFPNAMHRVWGPIPTEPVRLRASPSGFRPPPLVPGLFWFRARVIRTGE